MTGETPGLEQISGGAVDVWRIDLDRLGTAAWPQTLTADDVRRAGRFLRPSQRHHFLQARCCLRTLLARYAGLAPRALPLCFNAYGKPLLAPAHGLCFNLSHSGHLAVIAIGRQSTLAMEVGAGMEMEIGIDIERMRTPDDLPGLAQLVFSDTECGAFAALAEEQRTRAFLTGWTRKEAYLKALGVGLALDPRRVNAGFDAGRAHLPNLLQPGSVVVDTIDIEIDTGAIISLAICGAAAESGVRLRHCAPFAALEPAR